MRIFSDISQLIGATPMVRLNRLTGGAPATVAAKLEFFNPTSSVKDRAALGIIEAAEQAGDLTGGGTIVEATSGNTGIALTALAASRGYKMVITMPSSMSRERRGLLRALGAQLVLTPPEEGMAGAVRKAKEIVASTRGAIMAEQFENKANPAKHRVTTAEEIWGDTEGKVDVFIAGVGTGGTLSGVGKRLKEYNPAIEVIAVEPAESPLLSGGAAGAHGIQGLGANFIPGNVDKDAYDRVVMVPTARAMEYARRSALEEGLLVGISSGAAFAVAADTANDPKYAGKTIVVIAPDTGERYLSTPLFEGLSDD